MSQLLHRPTRQQSWCVATSTSLVCLAFVAFVCLCPLPTGAKLGPEYGTVIGIDLGITTSCVGVKRESVEIISNDQGRQLMPSWVSFTDNELLVGDRAKNAFHSNPRNTVFDVKRLLGRNISDPDLQGDMLRWPYLVYPKDDKPVISVQYKGEQRDFTPEEIAGVILGQMKASAEAYLGETVTHAIVTVPTYFDDFQRHAIKEAGKIAGLTVLRVINEPTAAAIAYGLNNESQESLILVYDLGGSTLDITLLSVDDSVFDVLTTAGDSQLGGRDFNSRVLDHLTRVYWERTGADVTDQAELLWKLENQAEKAKRTLSSQQTAEIEIDSFDGGKYFSETLTRAQFEEFNADLFNRTMKFVEQALKDANVKKEEINEVVLVGGSTRIPKIQQLLEEYFTGKAILRSIAPDEVVTHGAAIQGSILTDAPNICCIMAICPLTLGIETAGGLLKKMIPRNSVIPVKKSQIFSTVADDQPSVLIQIYEGDRPFTEYNKLIGKLELTGIPPAPRGTPRIEVMFDVDADGVLTVTAVDKGTGNTLSITISHEHHRLSEDEIEKLVLEAERYAVEDEALLRTCPEALDDPWPLAHQEQPGGHQGINDLDDEGKRTVSTAVMWIDAEGSDASIEGLGGKPPANHDEL